MTNAQVERSRNKLIRNIREMSESKCELRLERDGKNK